MDLLQDPRRYQCRIYPQRLLLIKQRLLLIRHNGNLKHSLGYTIVESGLIFTITNHNDEGPYGDTKKVYYKRFSEMLTAYFPGKFTTIQTGLF
ncbi:MAG: hypothetical protein M3015_14435 [Bacteroidota bacterium]|nr:hypothetical protein [Bacteroidota bacterium]